MLDYAKREGGVYLRLRPMIMPTRKLTLIQVLECLLIRLGNRMGAFQRVKLDGFQMVISELEVGLNGRRPNLREFPHSQHKQIKHVKLLPSPLPYQWAAGELHLNELRHASDQGSAQNEVEEHRSTPPASP